MEWLSDRLERNADYAQSIGALILLGILPCVLVGVPSAIWLGSYLHPRGCPPGTFLSSVIHPDYWAVALGTGVIGAVALGHYWLAQHLPALRTRLGWEHRPDRQRTWYVSFFTLVALGVSGGFYALQAGFCLTDRGILYRETDATPLKAYGWNDVEVVRTSCVRPRKNQQSVHYDLILRDGHSFNAARSVPDFEDGYARLHRALAGQNIAFVAQGIDPACRYRNLKLLT